MKHLYLLFNFSLLILLSASFTSAITKSNPPANDTCENAQPLNTTEKNDFTVDFRNTNFTQKPSCSNKQNEDLFYKITTNESGTINVSLSDSLQLTIYDGCSG